MLSQYLLLLEDENDKAIFETMYHQNDHKLHVITRGILHNQYDTEDAVQATWERVAIYFSAAKERYYKSPEAFQGWLVVVAKNAAIDEWKKRKRRDSVAIQDYWDESVAVDDEVGRESQSIHDMIHSMPDDIRIVLETRLYYDCSFAKMGKVLKCSEDAARMRYNRALEVLRSQLKENGYEYKDY